jgi:hypothetical protein
MPFIVKPIEEIKSIEIQPAIEKVENTELDAQSAIYFFILVLFLYLFRGAILSLSFFIFKFVIVIAFAFLTYSLVLT